MENLKAIVVDDSILYRHVLSDLLAEMPNVECVATASNGKIALRKVETLKPDLLLLDIEMPEMDGLQTLEQVKANFPATQVIMISGNEARAATFTIKSLEMGALDFIPKPEVKNAEEGRLALKNALTPLLQLVHTKKYTQATRAVSNRVSDTHLRPPGQAGVVVKAKELLKSVMPEPSPKPGVQQKLRKSRYDLVLIGISTGGPNALNQMLPTIKPNFPCPLVIVQHMPPQFTQSLAERLTKVSRLDVREALDKEVLENGRVYIAPGGQHLEIQNDPLKGLIARLTDSPPVNNCRPAVDVLYNSVARIDGLNILTVIMTGMGRDGTQGVRVLKQKGAQCLVQDEASSVVWGMPGSVFEAGLADEVLPLDEIGNRINELAG